jgi:CheY-like chemotaxis protein
VGPSGIVHQIVFNLIADALDSLPAGGAIFIATRNGKDGTDESDMLHLDVTADGPGLARRADASTPKLTSVVGLAGRLEGVVNVRAAGDASTCVSITLPATMRAERREKKMRRRLAPSRIWVADDDAVVREMCRRVLTEDGHTVEEVSSGADANSLLSKGETPKPDLVVYDYNMPDLSGREFCAQLRESGLRVPVLLIGGFKPDQPDVSEALKLRKTFYLQKPFSFRDMADMVTVALGDTLIEE